MKKGRILISLIALMIVASFSVAFAGFDKLPGVPKAASLVYSVTLSGPQKDVVNKQMDMFIKHPDFDKVLANLSQKANVAIPKEMVEKIKTMTGFTVALVADLKNIKDNPNVLLLWSFDNEKSAAEVMTISKDKMLEVSKAKKTDLGFKEEDMNGIKVYTTESKDKTKDMFKETELKMFVTGNTLGMVIFQKKNLENSNAFLKSTMASFKDEKESLASADKFKAAVAKVGASSTSLFYLDGEMIKAGAKESDAKMAEMINFIAFGGEVSADVTKVTTNGCIALNESKEEDAKLKMVKTVFGNITDAKHGSSVLPADVVSFFNLKLNLGKDFMALPEVAQYKGMAQMMGGFNLDEDLFSWWSGEIFVGVSDYTVDVKAVKENKPQDMEMPQLYVGLGCTNPEKANKFFEKLQGMLKPNGVEFKAETVGGAKVNVAELKQVPLKNALLTVGTVGNYFVVTTTKAAFEKVANAAAKPETSLGANADFKALNSWSPAAFISFYMNSEKLEKITNAMAELNPALKAQNVNLMKLFSATGTLVKSDITGSMVFTMDMSKFTPELIGQFFKTISEQSTVNKAEEKAAEPKKEETKVEEKAASAEEKATEAKPEEKKEETKEEAPAEKTE
ncbi:MAG: DUF3352 domain-containing protein [Candidatus Wallbacteria bacterium]